LEAFTPGMEGAGVIEKTGAAVSGFTTGERVAYAGVPGAYAEQALAPTDKLVHLPQNVSSEQGAAIMLQGMTAHYLAFSTYPLKIGHACLIHAASGGVGLLLVQIAKRCGAKVFGTVSTDEKADLARQAGADEIIFYTREDFQQRIRALTAGIGVDVVYDSVGRTTFAGSLKCLKPRGMLVSYGQSSGKIDNIDVAVLSANGSLYLTRPTLFHYIADRSSLEKRSGDLFQWIATGELNLRISQTYPLSEAARAHRDLEARKSTGKFLLIP